MSLLLRAVGAITAAGLLIAATSTSDSAPLGSDTAPLGKYTPAERKHWAFQPRMHPATPSFADAADLAWAKSPIDAFVLARMKRESLSPAQKADRATLIRRISLDMVGLPPTPAEVTQFVNDRSPKAWEKVVDRLLASEHYGERWGQHWLDIVRYSDSDGYEYDATRADAWRYRDYVIRAFTNDKPYDRFVEEQLAGDEIAPKEDEALIAAGFNRLGPLRKNAGNQMVASSRNEQLTEMTNIVGAGLLGVTLGCSRCHDHKFDPFRQGDYYRMQGFFAATEADDLVKASEEEQQAWKTKAGPIQADMGRLIKEIAKHKDGAGVTDLQKQLEDKQDELPEPLPSLFTVHDNFATQAEIHILARGDYQNKGERVGMRVPGIFLAEGTPELPGHTQKPRIELAHWIVSPDNPLTARVMVNRVWEYHFGRGIVATPNDFGRMGERPVNPELLDYLANEFVASGWSVKHVQRLILLSNTYQQDSQVSSTAREKDPDDRYLERFPRLRLDAEQIRDGMLSASGRLNEKTGGPPVMVPLDQTLVNALYKPSQWRPAKNVADYDRRSVYLIAKRNLALPFMQVFDAPDMQVSCPRREASTHAPQALEMLNGEFANTQAQAFADRLLKEAGRNPKRQVELAYRLTTGRPPKPRELHVALAFLTAKAPAENARAREQFAQAMFNLNAFLYMN
jgi:Protein of unknown function (DUF1553)/Protein of unknown function (DUF1549)